MKVDIEEIKLEDAQELLEFLKKIGQETDNLSFGAEGLPFTVEQEQQYILDIKNSNKAALFVAKHQGKIIGECSFSSFERRFSHRGEIGICVYEDYWGKGVGSKLLKEIITFAKVSANSEVISLEVRSDNIRAINLYKKFGFEKIGYYKKYFKVNDKYYDADLMNLYL